MHATSKTAAQQVFDDASEWGQHRLSGISAALLRLCHVIPVMPGGRRLVLWLRHPLKHRLQGPVDAEIWDLKLRLMPRGNLSESRWLFMPQFIDRAEREFMRTHLPANGTFVDIGANAGLYSFWAAAVCMGGGAGVDTCAELPPPDLVISSGGKSIFAARTFAAQHGVPYVYLDEQKRFPDHWFDVIVSPVPDAPRPNAIKTELLPTPMSPAVVERAAASHDRPEGRLWTMVIGGASRSHRYRPEVWRQLAQSMHALPEHNRFLPGLYSWLGFQQAYVEYARDERAAGTPKQSFAKLAKYAFDGILSFSYKPIRILGLLGMITAAAFSIALFFTAKRLLGYEIAFTGFTTLVILVSGLGGLLLAAVALVGEYVARIYDEVKQRPAFIVQNRSHSDRPASPLVQDVPPSADRCRGQIARGRPTMIAKRR